MDDQINRISTPMLVSVTENPDDETREMIISRHNKFLSLSEKKKYKLSSVLTSQKIQAIGKKYGFELLRLANITRLIREYYFGEVKLEDFPREIEKRMNVSLLTTQEIARYLKHEIIDWDPWAEYLAKLPKVSAREIVTKYPKVAEQEITGGYLEFKERPDDIFDPTIKNWLRDYVGHLGQTGHSSVDRMKYLFYSENARGLSSPDREKLGIILKSFDENTPLAVDMENNEVVFEIDNDQRSKNSDQFLRPASSGLAKVAPQPQKQTREDFIKPYSAFAKAVPERAAPQKTAFVPPTRHPTEKRISFDRPAFATKPKPQTQPQPIQKKIPAKGETRQGRPDTIRYANPYPAPGTHETPSPPEIVGATPVKMKGFSEGTPKDTQGSAFPPRRDVGVPQGQTFPAPPKPYVPRHPKNFIYPRNRTAEERPEPRIEGNIVDLSQQ